MVRSKFFEARNGNEFLSHAIKSRDFTLLSQKEAQRKKEGREAGWSFF